MSASFLFARPDSQAKAATAAAGAFLEPDRAVETELADLGEQRFLSHSGVDQSCDEHIAGDPGGAVEVQHWLHRHRVAVAQASLWFNPESATAAAPS